MLHYADLENALEGLHEASHWYVGFSGGVDSTVLLHLLQQWRAAHPESPVLSAIHVNHGLQAAAAKWQSHCADVCRALGLTLDSHTVDVGAQGRGEAAAREARYRVFTAQLQPGAVLFLGHQLDDQVETFFLRLLRGAGVEGLAAIPRRRALGQGALVRPLLDYSRGDIERYAAHHHLDYVEDPSNRDAGLDRNFLRQQLLPLLASRWPAYRQSVARASAHMAAAAQILSSDVPETVHSVMGDPGLSLAPLVGESADRAANALRAWLRAQGREMPDRASLQEFLRQLRDAAPDGRPRLVNAAYTLQRYLDRVYMVPLFAAPPPARPIGLVPGTACTVPGVGTVRLDPAAGDGLWLAPGEALELRWRTGGEYCQLPGRTGSRSLKSLFQEWGIPPWWRNRVPLVFLGEELLAVADLSRCVSTRWDKHDAGAAPWSLTWERSACASSD